MNKFVTFLASIAKVLIKPLFPVKFYGERKLDRKKLLLIGNHISGWDPVIYTLWSKTWISFVYKAEFRKSSFLRWVFDGLECVPIKRGVIDAMASSDFENIDGVFAGGDCVTGPATVIRAIETILKLLHEDKIVGLFPEGTRNPEVDCLQAFHTGAAMFAIKTHSPLRPFYIWEKTKVLRKNYIIVGDEFTLEEYYDQPITKEMLTEATEKVRNRVDALRVQLNGILQEKGVKRRKRTKKETEKINKYNQKQKTLAKQLAKQQREEKK